jgi:putative phosphoesterase
VENLMLRRMLLIGDVHAEDERLATALDHGAGRVDRVLCVGDIVDGPGSVARCIELLDAHDAAVVRGNHDRWTVAGRPLDARGHAPDVVAWLARLPETQTIETLAGPLLLCHGIGRDDMVRLSPEDDGYALTSNDALQELIAARHYRFVIGGHTHRRMVRRFGAMTVINPGTLLSERDPCCAILDLDRAAVDFLAVSPNEIRPLETVPLAAI